MNFINSFTSYMAWNWYSIFPLYLLLFYSNEYKACILFLFDKMFMSNLKVLTRCSYGMVSMYHINAL